MATFGSSHRHQQKKMLPLSILGFFLYSAIGGLVPFLNLHAKDLGLDTQEVFLANCGAAVFCLVFVPLIGLLAEKCARYKTCAVVCLVVAALSYTALLLVPRSMRSPRVPQMDFDCRDALRMEKCPNWKSCSDATASSSNITAFELSSCRYICHGHKGRRPPPDAAYPLHICFRSEEGNFCHAHNPLVGPPSRAIQEFPDDVESNSSSSFTFHSRFRNWYADDMPEVPIHEFLSYRNPVVKTPSFEDDFINEGIIDSDIPENLPGGEDEAQSLEENVAACKFRPVYPLLVHDKSYDDIFCRPLPSGCSVRCRVELKGYRAPVLCFDVSGDPLLTFLYYTSARAIGDACLMATIALVEVAIIASVRDYDGLYGRSRWSAALGLLLFPPIAGVLIDYYSTLEGKDNHPDYSPSFYLFDGLALVTSALLIALPLEVAAAGVKGKYVVNSPQRRQIREVSGRSKIGGNSDFCAGEMVIFLFLLIILGTLWSVMDTFLPPHYVSDPIRSSKFQVGITWTLAFLATLPFLIVSKELVRNIGRGHLLVFGFLFYGIRFAGISFVSDPYWTFPFEAMKAMTLSVVWIACVSYGHALVNFTNSLQSSSVVSVVFAASGDRFRLRIHYIILLSHFGLGRLLGSIIGYFLIESYGLEWTFRGFAIFSGSLGLLYLLAFHTCMKSCRMEVKKKQRRGGVVPPNVVMNGIWCPLVEQPTEQQRRPNGEARADQQHLLRQPAGVNDAGNEALQEQPILMIDDE